MDVDHSRVLIWYQGRGEAGNRFADRIAQRLLPTIPASHIAMALHAENTLAPVAQARGHTVYTIKGPSGRKAPANVLLSVWSRYRQFAQALDEFKPDVAIIAMNFALAWPILEALRARNVPIIYVAHDPEPHTGDYAPFWQSISQRVIIKRSSAVVALSNYGLTRLKAIYRSSLPAQIHMAPLHSVGGLIRQEPRERQSDGPTSFLVLGRLLPYKGFDLLASALEHLVDREDWRLTIAGNGSMDDEIFSLFGKFPQVDLSYVRWLDEAEVDHLLDSHDVIVSTCRDATQSGVVAEATLRAMPSVVTPIGGLPEQVDHGECGWVTRDLSSQEIAATLIGVIEDRAAYSETSRKVIEFWRQTQDDQTWGTIVAKTRHSR